MFAPLQNNVIRALLKGNKYNLRYSFLNKEPSECN